MASLFLQPTINKFRFSFVFVFMGNTNTVPVISQTKSLVQFVTGDTEGARDTQEKFLHECPIVAQTTSLVELAINKDKSKFVSTNKRTVRVLSNFADGIPVVGHVKGAIHAVAGDTAGAKNAIKSANRSVGVASGGVVGFLTAGPLGAVAGGIAGGAAMDGIQTGVSSAYHREFRPNGSIAAVRRVIVNPSGGAVFDALALPIFDGLGGYSAGSLAQTIQTGIASGAPTDTGALNDGGASSGTSSAASGGTSGHASAPSSHGTTTSGTSTTGSGTATTTVGTGHSAAASSSTGSSSAAATSSATTTSTTAVAGVGESNLSGSSAPSGTSVSTGTTTAPGASAASTGTASGTSVTASGSTTSGAATGASSSAAAPTTGSSTVAAGSTSGSSTVSSGPASSSSGVSSSTAISSAAPSTGTTGGSSAVSSAPATTAPSAPSGSTGGSTVSTATSSGPSAASSGATSTVGTTSGTSGASSLNNSATVSGTSSVTSSSTISTGSGSTAPASGPTSSAASSSSVPSNTTIGSASSGAPSATGSAGATTGHSTAPASAPAASSTVSSGHTSAAGSGTSTATVNPPTNTQAATPSSHSIHHHRPGSIIINSPVNKRIATEIINSTFKPDWTQMSQIAVVIPPLLLLEKLKWTTISTNVAQLKQIHDQLYVVQSLIASFEATPDKYPKQIDNAAPGHSLAFKMVLHEILRFVGPSQSRRQQILAKTERLMERVHKLVESDTDHDISSLFEPREHTLHCVHWNMTGISAPLLEHLGLVWYLVLDSPDVLLLSKVEASDYLITGLTKILGYKFLKFPASSILDDPLPGSALLFRPRENFICMGAGSEGEICPMTSTGMEIVWADFINLATNKPFRLASLQYADAPAQAVHDTMAQIAADQTTIFACSNIREISTVLQEGGFLQSSSTKPAPTNTSSSLRRLSSFTASIRRNKKFAVIDEGILATAADQPHVRCHRPQQKKGDPLNMPIPFSVGEDVNPSRLPCTSTACFYGCGCN